MNIRFPSIANLVLPRQDDHLTPAFREPFRHALQQGPGFWEKYDVETLFFDLFDMGDGNLAALCPPIGSHTHKYNLEFKAKDGAIPYRHFRRNNLDMLVFPKPTDEQLTVSSTLFSHHVTPSPAGHDMFDGRRALLFVNKNNNLQWIHDYLTFYVRQHGCDAVCMYDNGSTDYDMDDLKACINDVPGIEVATITHWPFKWGVTDGNSDSSHTQRALLEHARWRFLQRARSIVQCDIDELIFTGTQGSIFEAVETSETGYIAFKGRWVAPERAAHFEVLGLPRHHHFTKSDLTDTGWCGKKWACVPDKTPFVCQWMVHDIFGGLKSSKANPSATLRHFMGLNTGWKHGNRTTTDISNAATDDVFLTQVLQGYFKLTAPAFLQEELHEASRLSFTGAVVEDATRNALIEELTTRAPDVPWLAMLVARHFEKSKVDDTAGDLYRKVLELDDTVHEAWHFLSYIQERAGELEAAETSNGRALDLSPTDMRYLRRQVGILKRSKRRKPALELVKNALLHCPGDVNLLLEQARLLKEMKMYDEAYQVVQSGQIMEAVGNAETWLFYGELLVNMNRWDEAIVALEATLKLTPERPWTHHLISRYWHHMKDMEKARAYSQTALDLSPKNKIFQQALAKY